MVKPIIRRNIERINNKAQQFECVLCEKHPPELLKSLVTGKCLCNDCAREFDEMLKLEISR